MCSALADTRPGRRQGRPAGGGGAPDGGGHAAAAAPAGRHARELACWRPASCIPCAGAARGGAGCGGGAPAAAVKHPGGRPWPCRHLRITHAVTLHRSDIKPDGACCSHVMQPRGVPHPGARGRCSHASVHAPWSNSCLSTRCRADVLVACPAVGWLIQATGFQHLFRSPCQRCLLAAWPAVLGMPPQCSGSALTQQLHSRPHVRRLPATTWAPSWKPAPLLCPFWWGDCMNGASQARSPCSAQPPHACCMTRWSRPGLHASSAVLPPPTR